MGYVKYDVELFDYNKKYSTESEHKWDFMKDEKKEFAYYEKREKIMEPVIGNVQSNPEKTGQVGNI